MRRTVVAIVVATVIALCLAIGGCGLRGNLYLPPEPLEPGSSATAEPPSEVTDPTATQAGDPAAAPPEQPEPDEAIEGTDDFDDRSPEDRQP